MSDVVAATVLSIASLLQLGCWLAAWKHLHIYKRHSAHTFIDYGIGLLLMGTLPTLITGWQPDEVDGRPAFFEQLQQPIGRLAAVVAASGALLGLADSFMTITVRMIGLSLGPAISSSTSLALTIVMNYMLDAGLNDARLVFPGMAVAICAVVVGAITQARYTTHDIKLGDEYLHSDFSDAMSVEVPLLQPVLREFSLTSEMTVVLEHNILQQLEESEQQLMAPILTPRPMSRSASALVLLPGPPVSRAQLHANTCIGIMSAVFGGMLVALFVPAVNIACNDPFSWLPAGVQPLSIWTVNFFINLSLSLTCMAMGTSMLYRPQPGIARSTLRAWMRDHNGRPLALLSGVLNASGNMFQYMAGQRAGFAAAALSQTFPVVTTVLGLVAFREFRGASRGTAALLALQLGLYVVAAAILAASFKPRTGH